MRVLWQFTVLMLVAVVLGTQYSRADPYSCADTESAATARKSTINLKTSRVYVLVDKKGLGHAHAVEGKLKTAHLILDAKADAGQIVFDMTSFEADTDGARKHVGLSGQTDGDTQKKVNENMLGSKVLDVEQFPTATFDVDSSLPTGKKSSKGHPLYELKGNFTLHGTSHPLAVVAEAVLTDKSKRLRGKFSVLQTEYGIKPYSAALGAVGVADELTVWGEIDLEP